jgi:hypothetical protein
MDKIYVKPPLGVIPKEIYDIKRIQELCRALLEYSTYSTSMEEDDINYMIDWCNELCERLVDYKVDLIFKKEG